MCGVCRLRYLHLSKTKQFLPFMLTRQNVILVLSAMKRAWVIVYVAFLFKVLFIISIIECWACWDRERNNNRKWCDRLYVKIVCKNGNYVWHDLSLLFPPLLRWIFCLFECCTHDKTFFFNFIYLFIHSSAYNYVQKLFLKK